MLSFSFGSSARLGIVRVVHRLLLVLAAAPGVVFATEGGTTAFPNGGEDFLVAAMPPPGWYGIVYFNRYTADRLADDAGRICTRNARTRSGVSGSE